VEESRVEPVKEQLRLPGYDLVRKRIESIDYDLIRYCFMTAYIFAGRISEVVGYRTGGDTHTTPRGPRGTDVKLDEYEYQGKKEEIVVFTVRTAKREGLIRNVAVPVNYEPWAKPLYDYFKGEGENLVFPINRQTAWAFANEVFKDLSYPIEKYGVFTRNIDGKTHNGKKGTITLVPQHLRSFRLHALRHMRATELAEFFGFKGFDLATYCGWTLESTARAEGVSPVISRYLSLSWQGYIEKLFKKRRE